MLHLIRYIKDTLSVRLSLMIVLPIAFLLMGSLVIMLHYSRKALKEEALNNASQALDGAMLHIDNALLSVEQAAGNIYWDLLTHIQQPDRMSVYCRQLVQNNRYISGCAIAFEPYYYKDRGQYFMTYVYRSGHDSLATSHSPIIQAETFGNRPYTEQVWYTTAMRDGHPFWTDPLGDVAPDGEPIASFCMPIYDRKGKRVGVMGADVQLSLLTAITHDAKPSANSYCTLLGSDGSYIAHPDSTKLRHTVFSYLERDDNPSMRAAAEAMLSGESGYMRFHQNDGAMCYVFYKPFLRSVVPGRYMDDMHWSVGVVYPEDDIFGDYNRLLYYVMAIAIGGLLLLFACCWLFTRRQLQPLVMLTESARRIADGNYSEEIPTTRQNDEIGRLQNHFQSMQVALANHVGELNQLTATLAERHQLLRDAYHQAQEADRMKTAFLHNMSNQLLAPASAVATDVALLADDSKPLEPGEAERLTDNIQQNSKDITMLLNELLDISEQDGGSTTGKEDSL